jgi:hypothetical protein
VLRLSGLQDPRETGDGGAVSESSGVRKVWGPESLGFIDGHNLGGEKG